MTISVRFNLIDATPSSEIVGAPIVHFLMNRSSLPSKYTYILCVIYLTYLTFERFSKMLKRQKDFERTP